MYGITRAGHETWLLGFVDYNAIHIKPQGLSFDL